LLGQSPVSFRKLEEGWAGFATGLAALLAVRGKRRVESGKNGSRPWSAFVEKTERGICTRAGVLFVATKAAALFLFRPEAVLFSEAFGDLPQPARITPQHPSRIQRGAGRRR